MANTLGAGVEIFGEFNSILRPTATLGAVLFSLDSTQRKKLADRQLLEPGMTLQTSFLGWLSRRRYSSETTITIFVAIPGTFLFKTNGGYVQTSLSTWAFDMNTSLHSRRMTIEL